MPPVKEVKYDHCHAQGDDTDDHIQQVMVGGHDDRDCHANWMPNPDTE